MENLNKFWEQSKKFPVLFNEEVNGDFKKFVELFLYQISNEVSINGTFWVIDDFVGIYYLNHIVPEVDAQVHYSFFDSVQNGREELTKKMLSYVFNRYNFHRLSVNIPCFAHDPTFNFVERLGFKFEGKRREGSVV
jgi:RimJ/RimL family protein N-acetyltransferase